MRFVNFSKHFLFFIYFLLSDWKFGTQEIFSDLIFWKLHWIHGNPLVIRKIIIPRDNLYKLFLTMWRNKRVSRKTDQILHFRKTGSCLFHISWQRHLFCLVMGALHSDEFYSIMWESTFVMPYMDVFGEISRMWNHFLQELTLSCITTFYNSRSACHR